MKWGFSALLAILGVEENRLFFGKKIENFLNRKLSVFLSYLKLFFSNQFYGIFCCFLIVLLSFYKRSTVDIGQDSGLYIEIAQKILEGKKYYHDFFEYNFPLSFLILTIPVYISNLLNVTPIIIADYFVNLLAIFSLIWSYKILKNSKNIESQTQLNILIISLVAGFFIRGKTLIFNEFITKTSFFLIFLYPFFSYYVFGVEKLKKNQKIYLGILSGLIICLKPNFIILVAFFEIFRIFKSRNIKSLLWLHNIVCLFLITLYAIIIYIFFESFVENFLYMMRTYYDYISNYQTKTFFAKYLKFYDNFLINFFVYIALFFIYIKKLQKNQFTNYLFLLIFAIMIIVLTENYFIDQQVAFSSLFISFVIINFVNYLQQNRISISNFGLFLTFSLAIFCFLSVDIFYLASLILIFVEFFLFFLLYFKGFLQNKRYLCVAIFLILCLFASILFKITKEKNFIIFSSISTILFFINFNVITKKYHENKNFFYIINFLIFFATFSFLGSYFRLIFSHYLTDENYFYLKSPNEQNKKLFEIVKSNIKNNENIIIFAEDIENSYPFRNYAKLRNQAEFSQYQIITIPLNSQSHRFNKTYNDKALDSIYKQIIDPKNKVIIFYKNKQCIIDNIEFLIRSDLKIGKYFLENFKFLTEYNLVFDDDSFVPKYTKEFLNDNEFELVKQIEFDKIRTKKYDIFEAYVRK